MSDWPVIARRIRVPTGFVVAALYLYLARPSAWSLVVGAIIAISGLLIRAAASGHVRKNEQLTTSGPYAYTRNPLYLGSLILAVGFAVAARSWLLALVVALVFLAIYVPVIQSEEAFLRERFPEFASYAGAVPRLIPRATPFGNVGIRFSWDLYCKHREYNAAAGSIVLMLFLIVKLTWLSK